MRWDDAVRAAVARLEADATLTGLLGGAHVYRAGARRQPQIPSVEWFGITTRLEENTEPITVQFDIWARGYAAAVAIEGRLRALLHSDTPVDWAGLKLWSQYQDGRDHEDPEPGVVHRSVDYELKPARER